MSKINEKISALLDDGLDAEEIDELISASQVSREGEFDEASRYQMVGEVMRGQLGDASLVDVRSGVSAAIAAETLENSPSREQVSKPAQPSSAPLFDLSAWFRPRLNQLGGLAVAASVALVTVVAVTQMDQGGSSRNLVANTDTTTPDATVVNISTIAVAVNDKTPQETQQNQNAALLDAYLAEHAEFAAQDTMQGRMPYARAVSYESR